MNSYPHSTLLQEICIEVESDKQSLISFADSAEPYSPIDNKAEKDIDMEGVGVSSRILRFILRKTKIYELLNKHVSDPRRIASTIYSVASLLMCGMCNFILRDPSRHAFYDHSTLPGFFAKNATKLIHAPTLPSPKTLESLFLQLNSEDLESILPSLFHSLIRNKFFELHPEFKGDRSAPFNLSIDAQCTHVYHENNQHPCQMCPYCLKRVRGDSIWYVHYEVALCVIGAQGMQIPLFLHRVKKVNQTSQQDSTDGKFKQECELTALPHLLEKFRQYFPRLQAHLLLDGLYANNTAMNLADSYRLGWTIVRKEGSLRSINSEVEGLKKIQKPVKRLSIQGRWKIEQTAFLFQDMVHKAHTYSLVELNEKAIKLPSSRLPKLQEKSSHWQWIIKERTTAGAKIDTVFQKAERGRLRWRHEDFYNTLANRGFNIRHDFSRAPSSQTIWRLLMLIAFVISTLMNQSCLGCFARGSMSIVNWFKSIAGELRCIKPSDLWDWGDAPSRQLRFVKLPFKPP